MELRQLRYFLVICEQGSLTRAGATLHVAQQSLSQAVVVLESELGVRLLDRGSFGVRATAAGHVLYEKGSALLRDADAAVRAVQQAADLPGGEVRIRYGLDSEHLVNRLVARVHARLPHITITGWTGPDSDNLRALRAGDADLVVAWAIAGANADLNTAVIGDEQCWAAVPHDHHLATRDAVPVEALAGQPLVMFPRDAAPGVWDHIVARFTADGRLPPRIITTAVSGQTAMVDHALDRHAISPVSHSLIESLDRPGVRFVPFRPAIAVPAHLAWRHPASPATAAVIEVVQTGC